MEKEVGNPTSFWLASSLVLASKFMSKTSCKCLNKKLLHRTYPR